MSDFDKEAEREKLREKYEKEQQEREATEKMSELLLQGATMTNAHCSECGDPVFRYDGQEFCATCEKAVDRDTGEESDENEDAEQSGADGDQDDEEHIEVTTPDDSSRVSFGGQPDADQSPEADSPERTQQEQGPGKQEAVDRQSARQGTEAAESRDRPDDRSRGQSDQSAQSRRRAHPSESRRSERTNEVPSVEPSDAGDVTAARESLVRTLARFSQQAEATEDPQRAREYLAAAREAAEALSELRN